MQRNKYPGKRIFLFLICSLLSGLVTAQTYSTVSTFAGTSAAGLFDGPLLSAKFNSVRTTAEDTGTGTVYVADAANHAVRKIRNGIVTTLAGNGTSGDIDAQGTNARLFGPSGLCLYNGYIYITDNGNNKIKRIDTLGNVVTIAGTGVAGHQDGPLLTAKFKNPTGLTIDQNGIIYVADYLNHCIRKIENGSVSTYAGTPGSSGDQVGAAATAQFTRPSEVLLDTQGNLYVADLGNNRVKMITQSGYVSVLAGSGIAGWVDGTGTSAAFNGPSGMTWDLTGNIIIVDGLNHLIRRITTTGVVSTIAGTGASGLVNGPVGSATFYGSTSVNCLASGDLLVSDAGNNVIREITIGDVGISEFATGQLILFPNPSSAVFSITSKNSEKISEVKILDSQGKLVQVMQCNQESNVEINLAGKTPGLYFVEVIMNNQCYRTKIMRQ